MQADLWRPQPMAAHQDREMLATASADDHGHPHAHQLADHWDPTSILNPSMLNPDFLAQHNHFDHPGSAHSQSYHPANSSASQQQQQQQQHSQFASGVSHPPQHQGQFEPSTFDVYSQAAHNSFDSARFQPGAQQPVVDPSGNMNPPQPHEFFYAPQMPSFSQPNSDVGHPTHPTAHPTAHPQSAFDMSGMHSTPPITPNDGHRNASPYTISPVSDGSFAQQQQAYPTVLERPSTSDSMHSYHSDVPQDEFSLGGHSVVPSALHPFDHRPFMHMAPDVSNRNFLPHTVNNQPQHHPNPAFSHPHLSQGQLQQQPYGFTSQPPYIPEGAVHVTPGVLDSPSIFPTPASVTNSGSDIASFVRCVLVLLTRLRFAATLRFESFFFLVPQLTLPPHSAPHVAAAFRQFPQTNSLAPIHSASLGRCCRNMLKHVIVSHSASERLSSWPVRSPKSRMGRNAGAPISCTI